MDRLGSLNHMQDNNTSSMDENSIELRFVWNTDARHCESYLTVAEGISAHSRAPDAVGMYRRDESGTLDFISEKPLLSEIPLGVRLTQIITEIDEASPPELRAAVHALHKQARDFGPKASRRELAADILPLLRQILRRHGS